MRYIAPAIAMILAACTADLPQEQAARTISPILTSEEARDEFTFARPTEARVTHIALDLALDFEAQSVFGTATLDVDAADGVDRIVLDSDGLQVAGVTDGLGNVLEWDMGEPVEGKGEPLTIELGEMTGPGLQQVVVAYTSAPEAEALQWLAPEQTAGGKHPFLFSQGQAILNRTWIPTQDSPGIRQTWEARITAPEPLTVVMSGIGQGEPQAVREGEDTRAFTFRMDKPVAPYLIAIAAGDIVHRDLGPRTGVWAEPQMIDAAAEELADTEAMVDAAESLYGEYRWGRYDMIVLPPSFPYGGMENPVMTFLTPTFIAGDRSNTGLIAHELAHSWSGNLVTYASWRDGWLNEGVTSYIESRISEKVFGETRAAQERALSFAQIETMLEDEGADSPLTAMRTPEGTSPFDTAGAAIYDKGAVFLHTVESIVGREKFDAWLTRWFDAHAFEPATSEMFLADMRKNLIQGDQELEDRLMLDEWVYGAGLPDNVARPDPQVFAAVDAAAIAYADDRMLDAAAWRDWSGAEQQRFMSRLPEQIGKAELARLDSTLGLSETGNNEVLFLWLKLALANRYDPAVPVAREFLSGVGRNKFVQPLFETLTEQGEWGMAIARPLYEKTRPGYHSYTRGQVDPLFGIEG